MKTVTQTEIDAGWGNCYAACIASIFELDLELLPKLPPREEIARRAAARDQVPTDDDVKRFFEDERRNAWHAMWNEWFFKNNLVHIVIEAHKLCAYDRPRLETYHIIGGPSPRDPEQNKGGYGYDGLLHAVVGFKGLIVWDPHPDHNGLLAVDNYELIVPRDPAKPVLIDYRRQALGVPEAAYAS